MLLRCIFASFETLESKNEQNKAIHIQKISILNLGFFLLMKKIKQFITGIFHVVHKTRGNKGEINCKLEAVC